MLLQFGATPYDGFWFELGVIGCIAVMTVLALNKYLQKNKNFAALLLFLVFLNWTIAVVFSWLVKAFTVFYYQNGVGLDVTNVGPDITDISSYFIRMILDYRLLFIFVAIALYCSYMLRVKLFEKDYVRGERVVNVVFLIVIPILCFVLNQKGNMLFTVIVFAAVFVYMLLVYTPFMHRSLAAHKSADPKYRGAFIALAVMSLFFIITFLCFLLDQVILAITSVGYTPFYFGAWICAVIAIVLTYYGYIKPRGSA